MTGPKLSWAGSAGCCNAAMGGLCEAQINNPEQREGRRGSDTIVSGGPRNLIYTAGWCKGSIPGSEPEDGGSTPSPATMNLEKGG